MDAPLLSDELSSVQSNVNHNSNKDVEHYISGLVQELSILQRDFFPTPKFTPQTSQSSDTQLSSSPTLKLPNVQEEKISNLNNVISSPQLQDFFHLIDRDRSQSSEPNTATFEDDLLRSHSLSDPSPSFLSVRDLDSTQPPQLSSSPNSAAPPPPLPPRNAFLGDESLVMLSCPFWYQPDVSRNEVDSYLEGGRDGAFLIRHSTTQQDSCVLCLMFGTIVLHFLIERYDSNICRGGCFISGNNKVFSSVIELVAFYSANRGCLPCILRLPTTQLLSDAHEGGAMRASPALERKNMAVDGVYKVTRSGPEAAPEINRVSEADDTPDEIVGVTTSLSISSESDIAHRLKKTSSRILANFRLKIARKLSNRSPLCQDRLMAYVEKIVEGRTTEARTIDNFVLCTREKAEPDPSVVFRNVRQFLNGLRNYILIQHDEKFKNIIKKHSHTMLDEEEVVDVESIIEACLQGRVVEPLMDHALYITVADLNKKGDIRKLKDNMRLMAAKPFDELGVKETYIKGVDWSLVLAKLKSLSAAPSPAKKLKILLDAVGLIHDTLHAAAMAQGGESIVVGADDFLPLFIYLLAKTELDLIEAEATCMWGLLDQRIQSGEGGYYLTTLSSAIHVLKTYHFTRLPDSVRLPSLEDVHGFIRIFFPMNEQHIVFKTIPVSRAATALETTSFICRKFKIGTTDSYALYEVANGRRRRLQDKESPQTVRLGWPRARDDLEYYIAFDVITPE